MRKKFFAFFIFFAASGILLSGCETGSGVRNHVYTDNMPSLTAVPWETTVRVDTYSQYMETYTESTTVDSDAYFVFSRSQNVLRDTAAAFGGRPEGQGITAPPRDTAVVTQPPVTEEEETYTETATVNGFEDGEIPEADENTVTSVRESEISERDETSFSETTTRFKISAPPRVTGASVPPVERAPADTVYDHKVPADTRFNPAKLESDTNTTSGGTDNADKYTE